MHYHLEIIMPKTKEIASAISEIMAPFDENEEDADHPFWDWYIIGGRFAGSKEMCGYDKDKLSRFYKELNEKNVTVSGLQCGKQEISPASQIQMVDEIWNKYFPTENGELTACPIFAHSNNQYDSNDLIGCDISPLEDVPRNMQCSHVIIAGPSFDNKKFEAHFMLKDTSWNGVNHMDVSWDKTISGAVEKFKEKLTHYKEEYRERVTPKGDWICVTVDYHS